MTANEREPIPVEIPPEEFLADARVECLDCGHAGEAHGDAVAAIEAWNDPEPLPEGPK